MLEVDKLSFTYVSLNVIVYSYVMYFARRSNIANIGPWQSLILLVTVTSTVFSHLPPTTKVLAMRLDFRSGGRSYRS